jgi:hypothetical protein
VASSSSDAGCPAKSTAATIFVRGVTAAAAASTDRFPVSGSTSANTTDAPRCIAVAAVATKVIGVHTTSSPGPTPAAAYATCSAAVPDVTATVGTPPVNDSRSASKRVTAGPVVSQSPRRTAATAATSSSTMD